MACMGYLGFVEVERRDLVGLAHKLGEEQFFVPVRELRNQLVLQVFSPILASHNFLLDLAQPPHPKPGVLVELVAHESDHEDHFLPRREDAQEELEGILHY